MTVGELAVVFGLRPEGWEKGNALLKSLSSAVRTYLGIQAVKAVGGFVEHVTESATHLISLSQAMGMTVEQTQEWGYVAEQSGSNLKELSVGMSMLIGNMRRFTHGGGSKQFRRDMEELGVSQERAAEILADPNKLNEFKLQIADHIKKIGLSGNQSGFGRELFGARAGRAMVADMARGREGINELMERRRKMGVITQEEAFTLREVGNRYKDVKKSMEAMGAVVVAKLAPRLLELADAAVAWMAANKDIISGVFKTALEGIAGAFQIIGSVVHWLTDLVRKAMGGDDGATAILIGLAAAIISVVVPALWAMAAPIIAAMLPFIALAAAVALVAYGVLKLIKYGPAIKNAIGNALEWIDTKLTQIGDFFRALPETIKGAFVDLGDFIVDAFASAWESVKNMTLAALEWIANQIDEVPVLGRLAKLGRKIGGYFGEQAAAAETPDIDQTLPAPTANAPGGSNSNVTVSAPMTVNINGVKDAQQSTDAMHDVVQRQLKHAMADVGGQ